MRQRPSRQELIRRRRQDGFVGRQGEIAAFREVLRQVDEETEQFLFHIHGPAGVGKSTLVRQLETVAGENGAVTVYLDESVADVVEAMEAISAQMARQGAALKTFDKRLAAYRQLRHEATAGAATGPPPAAAEGEPAPVPAPSPSSVVASQVGLVGLGMIPGVGAFTGAVDPLQVAAGADRVRALFQSRRSPEDIQLVLSPLRVLGPVFLEDLAEAARRAPSIVWFFDTYERIGPLLDVWLRDLLISGRYGALPPNVLTVLAGQPGLAPAVWGDCLDLVTDWPLDIFSEDEARRLLTQKSVTDEHVVALILELSERLPVLVSTLAENSPASLDDVGDPSGTAVERFLKWEPDPDRRAVALACALPRQFDADVYRAAAPPDAPDQLPWLRTMPFVTDRAGQYHYHQVVRAMMLRLQRRRSPEAWQRQHTRIADAFAERRASVERGAAPDGGWWYDDHWLRLRLQEAYHRLCADPRGALPDALRELVDACTRETTLRRWAQTLVEAGRDGDARATAEWGERLLAALDTEELGLAALTLLIDQGRLDTAARAKAHRLRGRAHRTADRYDRALADYDTSLTLAPDDPRAYVGRGRTHLLTGRHDDALDDMNRAIEIDPGYALAFACRGQAHVGLARYDEALRDFDRAIEIRPAYAWAHSWRAHAYRRTGRFTEALADLDRAIDIVPTHRWSLTCRAQVYGALERYEEALADLDRVLELHPADEWILTVLGHAKAALARYDEALADFTRAITLSPASSGAHSLRGAVYRLLRRYDEAFADFDRAVELDPANEHALSQRGEAHRLLGRYEEALADLDRAIELDPADNWTLAARGQVYGALGRYEEAVPDLDRAIALRGTPDGWIHYERALARRRLGGSDWRDDLTRAVDLFTRDAGSGGFDARLGRGNLVVAHCALEAWEDAEAALAEFLACRPERELLGDAVTDLTLLTRAVPSLTGRVLPFRARLQEALDSA
ncbi:tetratricopeptide repeat protein [Streptomyces sp. NPDC006645]|uniref:tetratricopeptide repeat protein n=1 Tax=unclassified Streptomyces TaxID=2593676 RepID=UPI0033A54287